MDGTNGHRTGRGRRDEGAVATCPLHPGSRVTRNGTAVTASGRLQKYFCQPPNVPRHTFTEPVAGDGPINRPPRGHRYDAAVIARALLALARGATYRQARIAAFGGQPPARPVPDAAGSSGPADAKLVSRWLDTFGPLLRRELATAYDPAVTAARSVSLGRPSAAGGRRWLLCLTGWNPGECPRVWPVILTDRRDEPGWQALFEQADGRPAVLLCESPAQESAAVRVWGPSSSLWQGTAHGRVLTWPADEEDEVTGHAMACDSWAAQGAAGSADAIVARLARRATSIRAVDRADVLIGLMALEVSGLATAESMAAIVRGS